VADKTPHNREHSVEVQIPFAQVLFPNARIIAAIVADADAEKCTRFGKTLAAVLKKKRAIIVASSDLLPNNPPKKPAEEVDLKTLDAVTTLDAEKLQKAIRSQTTRHIPNLSTCACGEAPIMVAMAAAKEMGATEGRIISYAHSGNIPIGERNRVVGYGAVLIAAAYVETTTGEAVSDVTDEHISPADRKYLLTLARETINRFLTVKMVPLPRLSTPIRRERHGVFVTLKKKGTLRGCIGRMIPDRPLAELELVHVLVPAVERIEDRVVKVLQCLATANLDGAGDFSIPLEELLTDRAADDEDLQRVEPGALRFRLAGCRLCQSLCAHSSLSSIVGNLAHGRLSSLMTPRSCNPNPNNLSASRRASTGQNSIGRGYDDWGTLRTHCRGTASRP